MEGNGDQLGMGWEQGNFNSKHSLNTLTVVCVGMSVCMEVVMTWFGWSFSISSTYHAHSMNSDCSVPMDNRLREEDAYCGRMGRKGQGEGGREGGRERRKQGRKEGGRKGGGRKGGGRKGEREGRREGRSEGREGREEGREGEEEGGMGRRGEGRRERRGGKECGEEGECKNQHILYFKIFSVLF